MSVESTKVLVIGPPSTSIHALFDKIAALTSKHNFNLTLVAGDLFESANDDEIDAVINGSLNPPIDVYYTLGRQPPHASLLDKLDNGGGAIAQRVFMLAKSSVLTTRSGLRIGAFGGVHDTSTLVEGDQHDNNSPAITQTTLNSFTEFFDPRRNTSDSSSLAAARAHAKSLSNANLDILLTHSWPSSITLLSNKPLPNLAAHPPAHSWGSSAVTSAVSYSTPKYVFSGGQRVFWEREPFVSPNGLSTRFISLGQFGNTQKQRSFYAFSITPRGHSKEDVPPASTSSPLPALTQVQKRSAEEEGKESGNSYIFAQQASAYDEASKRGKKNKRHQGEISQDECWFCLSNPRVTKHLIVSIGEECYITLPKGQLIDPATSAVPGGGHVLIIPISHYPNLFSLPADIAQRVQSELLDWRDALARCYAKYNSSLVSYELGRYWSRGGHAHIQAVPIPNEIISALGAHLTNEGVAQGVEWESDPQKALDELEDGQSYLRVDLPNGGKFVHLIRPAPFNQQFARLALASFLDIPQRADWRNCTLPDEQETDIANDFRNAFKHFEGGKKEIEIVNAIYGEGSATKDNGNIRLRTSISVDSGITLRTRLDNQSVKLNVGQLPPTSVTFTLDGSSSPTPMLSHIEAVAGTAGNKAELERLIREESEEGEGELLRTMHVLHAYPPASIQVQDTHALATLAATLRAYNRTHAATVFAESSYDCPICLRRRKGVHGAEMPCGCAVCAACLRDMTELHVREGSLDSLICPSPTCTLPIPDATILEVSGERVHQRVVYLRQKKAAEDDPRTVYCPLCHTPVARPPENALVGDSESDEGAQRLRVCPQCSFAFCCYCRRTYHGPVAACPVSTTLHYVRAYAHALEQSNSRDQLALESRYGRKYLQRLLADFLESEASRRTIENTAQACPHCAVRTEKSSGCNHMSCRCGTHFCFLCGGRLVPSNPYPHFNTPGTYCFQKLFDDLLQNQDGAQVEQDNPYNDIAYHNGFDDDDVLGLDLQLAIMQIAHEHMQ
ncbi:hypothetical protein E3P84_02277 [Wallemia ichthyophaga]|nr:hypothetical protein E3P84_02277 [Wallemia ichthyophaga]TIB41221.1 hypothetical protein E3P83_02230 [Wallemia ichthyophaga]